MSEKKLTGIERELVLKYLIDGNVPVTITPVLEKKDSSEIKSVETLVLPVLVRREKMAVLKEGIIFLQNVPESIKILEDKEIKVELTPYQQKVEDEINEFLHQEITWEKVHDFLFQEVKFGK